MDHSNWPTDCPGTSLVAQILFPGKESACQCRRPGFDPWEGRSSGEGNGNPLQYSCLENPMDRGAWRATVHTVHGVTKSRTRLSSYHFHLLSQMALYRPGSFE